ncbi:F-box protein, partial [Legionella pneumophila]
QKLLPMHVVYEYCSNEPFYPVPKFTSQPKSSKQFFNWVTEKDENWFGVDSKLGSELAIFKGFSGGCASSSRDGGAST